VWTRHLRETFRVLNVQGNHIWGGTTIGGHHVEKDSIVETGAFKYVYRVALPAAEGRDKVLVSVNFFQDKIRLSAEGYPEISNGAEELGITSYHAKNLNDSLEGVDID
jgi:hypothetical protein